MKTKKIKIEDLKIDPTLTNIRHVNPVFVSRYRQAYRNGAIMPLIIVQEIKKKLEIIYRVISGNHRTTAVQEEYEPEHEIEVEVRQYKNEREVLEDFARENSRHGNPIDEFTKKKLTNALLTEGATPESIAVLFNVSVRRIEKLGDDIVQVEIGKGKTEDRPSKKGYEPEKPITEVQYEEHCQKDRGLTVVQQANQLSRWLSQGIIPYSESNVNALKLLKKEIDLFFKKAVSLKKESSLVSQS